MMQRKARLAAGFFFCCLLLMTGCAVIAPQSSVLRGELPAGLPLSTDLDVPFFAQADFHCGPAALAMALNHAGLKTTPGAAAAQVFLPGRQGSLQVEMLGAARQHGMVAYVLEPSLDDLLLEVAHGNPVIMLENQGPPLVPVWHYAVAVGFDIDKSEIKRHTGAIPARREPLAVFEYFWAKANRWAMLALPPERVPATAKEARYGEAVAALERVPGHTARASRAYAALLERWPASLIGWMGRGNTAHALGDLAGAEAAFRRAAELHPHAAAAHNNLAQTLLDRGQVTPALAAAERAVSLGGPLQSRAQETLDAIRARMR
jgi:tetratricopeptide (TPR) repeat protein